MLFQEILKVNHESAGCTPVWTLRLECVVATIYIANNIVVTGGYGSISLLRNLELFRYQSAMLSIVPCGRYKVR